MKKTDFNYYIINSYNRNDSTNSECRRNKHIFRLCCRGAIDYADSFGLMKGYDDGTFKPDNNMTRAEFTSALMRAAVIANPDAQLAEINFSDIDKSYWVYDDIAKAVSIGFISGYDDGTFRPADNVTYEQAITMIFNVLGYKPVADLYGGYPHAYMSLGYYNRFFKSSTDNRNGNIEMNETKEKTAITRRDAMDMLGGMLFTPICVVTDYKLHLTAVMSRFMK